MSASKSNLAHKLLDYYAAWVKVKDETDAPGPSSAKNTASEKEKKILTFVKKEKAAFTFVKNDNDAAFAKKEKDEEAEVAYHCGAASKSGKNEEMSEEEVCDVHFGVVDAAFDPPSDDDVVIIDAAAMPKSTLPS